MSAPAVIETVGLRPMSGPCPHTGICPPAGSRAPLATAPAGRSTPSRPRRPPRSPTRPAVCAPATARLRPSANRRPLHPSRGAPSDAGSHCHGEIPDLAQAPVRVGGPTRSLARRRRLRIALAHRDDHQAGLPGHHLPHAPVPRIHREPPRWTFPYETAIDPRAAAPSAPITRKQKRPGVLGAMGARSPYAART